jgi:hypothetical protein
VRDIILVRVRTFATMRRHDQEGAR